MLLWVKFFPKQYIFRISAKIALNPLLMEVKSWHCANVSFMRSPLICLLVCFNSSQYQALRNRVHPRAQQKSHALGLTTSWVYTNTHGSEKNDHFYSTMNWVISGDLYLGIQMRLSWTSMIRQIRFQYKAQVKVTHWQGILPDIKWAWFWSADQ